MSRDVRDFYVVWCPQSGPPTVRHPDRETAMAEARRLAARLPGMDFFVLNAVGGFHMPAPGPEELVILTDELPF